MCSSTQTPKKRSLAKGSLWRLRQNARNSSTCWQALARSSVLRTKRNRRVTEISRPASVIVVIITRYTSIRAVVTWLPCRFGSWIAPVAVTRWSGLLQTFQRDLVATPATTVDVRPGIPGRGAATFARQAWDALHDLEAGRVADRAWGSKLVCEISCSRSYDLHAHGVHMRTHVGFQEDAAVIRLATGPEKGLT